MNPKPTSAPTAPGRLFSLLGGARLRLRRRPENTVSNQWQRKSMTIGKLVGRVTPPALLVSGFASSHPSPAIRHPICQLATFVPKIKFRYLLVPFGTFKLLGRPVNSPLRPIPLAARAGTGSSASGRALFERKPFFPAPSLCTCGLTVGKCARGSLSWAEVHASI